MGTDDISKDLNLVDNSIWYVCKYCRRAYQHKHQLIEHKKTKHYEQLLQASNEKKLAKKKLEDENEKTSGNGVGMVNSDHPSATVTSTCDTTCPVLTDVVPEPSEHGQNSAVNPQAIINPIPIDTDMDPAPIDDSEKLMASVSLQYIVPTSLVDSSTPQELCKSENHCGDKWDNVNVVSSVAEATATCSNEFDTDAKISEIDINEMSGIDVLHSEAEPDLSEVQSEATNKFQHQFIDTTDSFNFINTNTGLESMIDESDSEIECVFDSHRPLGSPMKPLSPTPVTVHANTSTARTWNLRGTYSRLLPPVPRLTDSSEQEHENENFNYHTVCTGLGSGAVKRKFLSLSSSDYRDLDSTREVIAKLEVLGEHHYCRKCFKRFLRPSSYKAHRKICHLKTISSFREFKSKFQIEVLPSKPCQTQSHGQPEDMQVPSLISNAESSLVTNSVHLPSFKKSSRSGQNHVLVKIPEDDQVKVKVSFSFDDSRRQTRNQNKIRKIDCGEDREYEAARKSSQTHNQSPTQNQSQIEHTYTCKLCGSSFVLKSELTSHLLVHMSSSPDPGQRTLKGIKPSSGQSQCPSSKSNGKSNENAKHIGERRTSRNDNSNNKCKRQLRWVNIARSDNKKYTTKSAMKSRSAQFKMFKLVSKKIFYRFHTRGKLFFCPVCCSGLKSKSKFCLHMKNHRLVDRNTIAAGSHLNTSNSSYRYHDESCVCKLCFKSFYQFEDLLQHLRNHTFSPVSMEEDYQ